MEDQEAGCNDETTPEMSGQAWQVGPRTNLSLYPKSLTRPGFTVPVCGNEGGEREREEVR